MLKFVVKAYLILGRTFAWKLIFEISWEFVLEIFLMCERIGEVETVRAFVFNHECIIRVEQPTFSSSLVSATAPKT